ncbi:hypothetical protein [Bacillus sp. ISL-46]|uniref:hypothetical protein n=1 Tax=Bacillus sp. ISL-46 TaxID=2819129 RepID=UPI001BE5B646|nr:hypothetical protein [Bacillus sp. ISL-46]MBT2722300.1 hypothetical protein [Bacillus sp. ISL-46]
MINWKEDFDQYYDTRMKEFQRSYNEFLEITDHEEAMIVVIRAHLYIEQEINQLLHKVLEIVPDMTFSQKINFCKSLLIIDKDMIGPLNKFNTLRNSFAHNLNFKLEEKNYDDLVSTLSKSSKEQFYKDLSRFHKSEKTLLDKLRILLASIWADTKVHNMYFIFHYQKRAEEIIKREKELVEDMKNSINK